MRSKEAVERIRIDGFVNAGNIVLTDSESAELSEIVRTAYQSAQDLNSSTLLFANQGGSGLQGLPEHHPRIAELLDLIVSSKYVKEVLSGIMGDSYKIWQIDYRRSLPGDRGLSLHQDAIAQFNIAIMLSSNPSGDGATCFVRGSHLVKSRLKDLGLVLPRFMTRYLSIFLTPLSGLRGDIGFFLNRTWHGRFSNLSKNNQDVILIGLFPAGASFGLDDPYHKWTPSFLDSPTATTLKHLLDPSINTETLDDGRFCVKPNLNNESVLGYDCFAKSIEFDESNSKTFFNSMRLGILFSILYCLRIGYFVRNQVFSRKKM
jgi:non-heme Fe2+,alpha-ketoglutarate-dependent halogenase